MIHRMMKLQCILLLLISLFVTINSRPSKDRSITALKNLFRRDLKWKPSDHPGVREKRQSSWWDEETTIDPEDFTPQQIHLSLGDDASEMVIMFATVADGSDPPIVRYGISPNNYSLEAQGGSEEFYNGNRWGVHNHHRVKLHGLQPATTYSYQVEYNGQTGVPYDFTTMPEGKEWSPEFVIYGDLGRKGGAPSIRALKQEAHTGRYTAFIHTGDFAYNFHDEDGQRGDNFMRRIQDIAARVPYMTCPGNHEIWYDFSHYRYRFSAPRSDWPIQKWQMWYSFDVANIHFISYSSEVYFTDDELYAPAQIKWLEKDLTEANSPSNRTQRPWIIVFGHRPMYCSNLNRDDCTTPLSKVRIGLEDTFYKYGVDLIIEAHEHSYERLYPVYHGQVTNCDYKNPRAPAHIIGGAAGCNEQFGLCADVVLSPRGPWSAFRSWLPGLNGYGRLKVFNNTHLYYEQMLAMTGQVMDRFWLVQTNHGPYNETFNPDTEHCSSN